MSTGAVIAIVVVIIVVIAALALGAMEMRRRRLRRQFGPEYDRLVTERGSRRKAEAELAARQRRVAKLEIRPLTREENARYQGEWNAIQERFVDTPTQSVSEAATLVTTVMRVRGYPAEDHDEAMDALSVDHAPTLARYRDARATSERAAAGSATTDDLRNAMLQYRELFHELVVVPAGEADGGSRPDVAGETPAGTPATAGTATPVDTASTADTPAADGTSTADTAAVADTAAPDGTARTEPEASREGVPGTEARPATTATTHGTPADPAGPADTTPDDAVTGDAVSPQRSTRG